MAYNLRYTREQKVHMFIMYFYHILNLTLVNSWLLYKRVLGSKDNSDYLLNQEQFRTKMAKCLCSVNVSNSTRERLIDLKIQAKNEKNLRNMFH